MSNIGKVGRNIPSPPPLLYLLVEFTCILPGMANKAQVANNGKYNLFAVKYWQIRFLAVKCSRYPEEVDLK